MAKKKKPNAKQHGHYCKVCGQHKANEKFSGKGHASHICKACMSLSPSERSEEMTLNRIQGMAFRYLSESEIKWLRGKMNDERPEIRDAAREAHSVKFPHYERNIQKKGLTARSLDFFIHGDIWDEYGDEVSVHSRFLLDHTGVLQHINYTATEAEQKAEAKIGQQTALKFLKAVVQQLNAPFWPEELSDSTYEFDPQLDVLPEFRDEEFDDNLFDPDEDMDEEYDADEEEPEQLEQRGEPLWTLTLDLNKGGKQHMAFYNQMHDAPQELFWLLMEWFEQDDEEEYEETDPESCV